MMKFYLTLSYDLPSFGSEPMHPPIHTITVPFLSLFMDSSISVSIIIIVRQMILSF